jgi:Protein of unknown function (DUF3006)
MKEKKYLKVVLVLLLLVVTCNGVDTSAASKLFPHDKRHAFSASPITYQTKGVVDRIEGNDIVILMEKEQKEVTISKEEFPLLYSQGTWLDLVIVEGHIVDLSIDWVMTNKKRDRVKALLEVIRAR